MLVLTRKLGESIFIDGKTKISVVEVKGGSVKIGIDAPDHVLIYRGEVFEKILRENQMASKAELGDVNGVADLLKNRIVGKR